MSSLSHITIGNVVILRYRYNEILLQLNEYELFAVRACVYGLHFEVINMHLIL